MKVVFIIPADDIRRSRLYRLGNRFYGHSNAITGPLILGRILKDAGHTVEVYEELYHDINLKKAGDADVICFYTMTTTAERAYALADDFRRIGKRVLIGGMHASALPEEALRHADQVVVGEAERVIVDVVEGRITDRIVNAQCLENLDDIPFPDYSLLQGKREVANVMTSRGCPFSCNFCTTSRMFAPYRRRSPENVISELRMYKEQGFKYVNFEDDNFTADKDRAKEILRLMIKNHLVFRETFFFGRTDMAKDEELLQLLHDAHLNRVLVGIESLNQKSLDYINKKQKIQDIEECSQALLKYRIRMIASLVLGLDCDSVQDIRNGVKFCKKIHAYQLQPAVLTPFPNTPVYEQFAKEGRLLSNGWSHFDMMTVNFLPKNMSSWKLQKEFLHAVASFYTFASSFVMLKFFGVETCLRRLGMWLVIRVGRVCVLFISLVKNGNIFNRLRMQSVKAPGVLQPQTPNA
ncbi:MAG: radical SAM protein [Clostridia bacterium]|nr:radical SAM protein [Clostridia bacterium]